MIGRISLRVAVAVASLALIAIAASAQKAPPTAGPDITIGGVVSTPLSA